MAAKAVARQGQPRRNIADHSAREIAPSRPMLGVVKQLSGAGQ
jgi:hypothetical protein